MKNEYEIRGEVTLIFLNRRDGTVIETLIDTPDLPKVQQYNGKWYASWSKTSQAFYVKGNKGHTTIKLYRFLTDAPDSKSVDHINRNPLDNRRANLRIVDHAENMQNVEANKTNKTGIRGVGWHAVTGKWQARIQVDKKQRSLGFFDDIAAAEQTVKDARAKLMSGSKEFLEAADKEHITVKFGLGDRPTKSNRSGVRGVGWHKALSKWRARLQVGNKSISVGYFDDIQSAAKAIEEARQKYKVESPI